MLCVNFSDDAAIITRNRTRHQDISVYGEISGFPILIKSNSNRESTNESGEGGEIDQSEAGKGQPYRRSTGLGNFEFCLIGKMEGMSVALKKCLQLILELARDF